MALGPIVGSVREWLIDLFVQIVFELGIKGLGWYVLSYLPKFGRKKEIDPDGLAVILTGIAALLLILFGMYKLWQQIIR